MLHLKFKNWGRFLIIITPHGCNIPLTCPYTSYKIAKKFGWDAKSTARGGLLHDLFFYDWRDTKFNKSHAWVHPRITKRNAQKLIQLNKLEEDIIVKHMFGATISPPRYKESWIVTCVDKYWAVREWSLPMQHKWKKSKVFRFQ